MLTKGGLRHIGRGIDPTDAARHFQFLCRQSILSPSGKVSNRISQQHRGSHESHAGSYREYENFITSSGQRARSTRHDSVPHMRTTRHNQWTSRTFSTHHTPSLSPTSKVPPTHPVQRFEPTVTTLPSSTTPQTQQSSSPSTTIDDSSPVDNSEIEIFTLKDSKYKLPRSLYSPTAVQPRSWETLYNKFDPKLLNKFRNPYAVVIRAPSPRIIAGELQEWHKSLRVLDTRKFFFGMQKGGSGLVIVDFPDPVTRVLFTILFPPPLVARGFLKLCLAPFFRRVLPLYLLVLIAFSIESQEDPLGNIQQLWKGAVGIGGDANDGVETSDETSPMALADDQEDPESARSDDVTGHVLQKPSDSNRRAEALVEVLDPTTGRTMAIPEAAVQTSSVQPTSKHEELRQNRQGRQGQDQRAETSSWMNRLKFW